MTHIRQWTWWSVLAVMSLLSTKYKHWINVVASVKLYFPVQLEWMWLIERQSFILRHSVFLRSFFSLSLKLIQLLTTTRTHHSRSPFIWFDTWNDVFHFFQMYKMHLVCSLWKFVIEIWFYWAIQSIFSWIIYKQAMMHTVYQHWMYLNSHKIKMLLLAGLLLTKLSHFQQCFFSIISTF